MHWKTALYLGLGVTLGIAVNAMIAGVVNPVLASVKLSVSLT